VKAIFSQLNRIEEFKGVSLKENVSAIELLNPDFIESPGWIAKFSSLSREGNKHIGGFFKQG